jgi:hypothetical protein
VARITERRRMIDETLVLSMARLASTATVVLTRRLASRPST